jgi:hypothetical protein
VEDEDWSIGAQLRSYGFDPKFHGSKRVLALRRSVVGNYDGLISTVERHVPNGFRQDRQRQSATVRRNQGVLIVGAFPFHDAVSRR